MLAKGITVGPRCIPACSAQEDSFVVDHPVTANQYTHVVTGHAVTWFEIERKLRNFAAGGQCRGKKTYRKTALQ